MITWLESKIGWLQFPSIIKHFALFQIGVLGLTFLNPGAGELMSFRWDEIQQGQLWRLFTFIFTPSSSLNGSNGEIDAFFALFAAILLMNFSDGLEAKLGTFRVTLFFLFGWINCALASIILSIIAPMISKMVLPPAILFDFAILFAFALYYPKFKIMLLFFIPTPIVIIALLSGVMVLTNSLSSFQQCLYTTFCLLHFIVLIIPQLRNLSQRKELKNIRPKASKKQINSFHYCKKCNKTDLDDSSLSFRVTNNGEELCTDCLKQNIDRDS